MIPVGATVKVAGLSIPIGGDIRPLRKAINEGKAEATGLVSVANDIKDALVDAFVKPAVEVAQFSIEAAEALDSLVMDAVGLSHDMEQVDDAFDEAKLGAEGLARAEDKVKQESDKVKKSTKETGDEAEKAGRKAKASMDGWRLSLSDVRNSLFNVKTVIAGIVAGVGTGGMFAWLIKGNAEMEQYQSTLETVLKSQEKAAAMLQWAKNFAATTPYEIPEIVQGTVRLEAYGLAAQKWMPMVGDMASVMKKDVMQAVEAIGDAMVGEMERLKEFGITKGDLIAKGLKVNGQGQITDMASMTEALVAIWQDRFVGGMEKQSKTFNGMLSNLMDNLGTFSRKAGSFLFEERIKPALQNLLVWFGKVQKDGSLDKWATATGIAFGKLWDVIYKVGSAFGILISWIGKTVGWFAQYQSLVTGVAAVITYLFLPALLKASYNLAFTLADAILKGITGLIALTAQFAASATAAYAAAAAYLVANAPVILLTAAITGLVIGLGYLVTNWDKAKVAGQQFVQGMKNYFATLNKDVINVLGSIGQAFVNFGNLLTNVFNPAERAKAWNALKASLLTLKTDISKLGSDAWSPIGKSAEIAADAVVDTMSKMIAKIKTLFAGSSFDFDAWLKKNGFDPKKLAEEAAAAANAGNTPLTADRLKSPTASAVAKASGNATNQPLEDALEYFEKLKSANDDLVGTYEKQARWLEKNVLNNDRIKLQRLEQAKIEQMIFDLQVKHFEDTAKRQKWTAIEQEAHLKSYVGDYAKGFDAYQTYEDMKTKLAAEADAEIAKGQDKLFDEALKRYENRVKVEEAVTKLSAKAKQEIYKQEVLDKININIRSEATQQAIDSAELEFKAGIAKEEFDLAQEQSKLMKELRYEDLRRTKGDLAAELEEIKDQYDERMKVAVGNADLIKLVEADRVAQTAAAHEKANKAIIKAKLEGVEAQKDLLGSAEYAADLKAIESEAIRLGLVYEGLSDKVQAAEKVADKESKDATDRYAEQVRKNMELTGKDLDAKLAAIDAETQKAIDAENGRQDTIALIRQNADLQKQKATDEYWEAYAKQQAEALQTVASHEAAMGEDSKKSLRDSLATLQTNLREKKLQYTWLDNQISELNKQVTDEETKIRQAAADRVKEIYIKLLESQNKAKEAAQEQERLDLEQSLRDTALTEEMKADLREASRLRMLDIDKKFDEESARLRIDQEKDETDHLVSIGKLTEREQLKRLQALASSLNQQLDATKEFNTEIQRLDESLTAEEAKTAKDTGEAFRTEAEATAAAVADLKKTEVKAALDAIDREAAAKKAQYEKDYKGQAGLVDLLKNVDTLAEADKAKIRKKYAEDEAKRLITAEKAEQEHLVSIGRISEREQVKKYQSFLSTLNGELDATKEFATEINRLNDQVTKAEEGENKQREALAADRVRFMQDLGQKSLQDVIDLATKEYEAITGSTVDEQKAKEKLLSDMAGLYRQQVQARIDGSKLETSAAVQALEDQLKAEMNVLDRSKEVEFVQFAVLAEAAGKLSQQRINLQVQEAQASLDIRRTLGQKALEEEIKVNEAILADRTKSAQSQADAASKLVALRKEQITDEFKLDSDLTASEVASVRETLSARLTAVNQSTDAGKALYVALSGILADLGKKYDEAAAKEMQDAVRLSELKLSLGMITKNQHLADLQEQVDRSKRLYGEDSAAYLQAVQAKRDAEKKFADEKTELDAKIRQFRVANGEVSGEDQVNQLKADISKLQQDRTNTTKPEDILAIDEAILDKKEKINDIEESTWDYRRKMGQVTTKEYLAWIRQEIAAENQHSDRRKRLVLEEAELQRQQNEADKQFQQAKFEYDLRTGKATMQDAIARQQQEVESYQEGTTERIQAESKLHDLRVQDANDLISWTEKYVGSQIEAGKSTKSNLYDALVEVHRILEENGIAHEGLAEKIKQVNKEVFDESKAYEAALFEYKVAMSDDATSLLIQAAETELAAAREKTKEHVELEQELYELRERHANEQIEHARTATKGNRILMKEWLEQEREKYVKAGAAGEAYVEAIDKELKNLKNSWVDTWADAMAAVMTGQKTISEAMQGVLQGYVQERVKASIETLRTTITQATAAGKTFWNGMRQGAMAFMASNAVTLIIQLIAELFAAFTAYQNAQKALAEKEKARKKEDEEYEKRITELRKAGFTREATYRKQTEEETASYLFGLIKVTFTRTFDVLDDETKAWIERINGYLQTFQSTATSAMNNALSVGDAALGWRMFLKDLRQGIYESIVDGIIEAFVTGQIATKAIAPFIEQFDAAMQEAMKSGSFDPGVFENLMGPALAGLEQQLSTLGPQFDAIYRLIQQVRTALNLTTDIDVEKKRGGLQVSEITGATRDLLTSLLSPLARFGEMLNHLSIISEAVTAIRNLAESTGLAIQLPTAGLAAAGLGNQSGTSYQIGTMNNYFAPGSVQDPEAWLNQMGREADRISGRTGE
jgi:hypothetical protein